MFPGDPSSDLNCFLSCVWRVENWLGEERFARIIHLWKRFPYFYISEKHVFAGTQTTSCGDRALKQKILRKRIFSLGFADGKTKQWQMIILAKFPTPLQFSSHKYRTEKKLRSDSPLGFLSCGAILFFTSVVFSRLKTSPHPSSSVI